MGSCEETARNMQIFSLGDQFSSLISLRHCLVLEVVHCAIFQIEQVETDHQDLLKLKENNWTEVEEVKPVPTTVLNPKVVNKPAVQKTNPKKTGTIFISHHLIPILSVAE